MSDRVSNNIRVALKRLFAHRRASVLREAVEEFIEAVQEEGYHMSDIILALADFARSERIDNSPCHLTWDTVAALGKTLVNLGRLQQHQLMTASQQTTTTKPAQIYLCLMKALLEAAAIEAEAKGRELP